MGGALSEESFVPRTPTRKNFYFNGIFVNESLWKREDLGEGDLFQERYPSPKRSTLLPQTAMFIDNLTTIITQHESDPDFFRDELRQRVDLFADGAEHPELPATSIVLGEQAHVLFRKANFAGQRVAVVAHWSPNGLPDAALQVYLTALREAGFRVVVTCGCRPGDERLWQIHADALIWRECSGYDFTSWKAALEALPELFDAAELVLANDSVLGPMRPLSAVHADMDKVNCDFWGLVESRETRRHLQSFYLVFRKQALRHSAFAAFWPTVDTNADKFATVLRYETMLSPWLAGQGLMPAALVASRSFPPTNVNPCHYFWRPLLLRFGMPFLKRDLIRRAASHPFMRGWETVLRQHGYDPALALPPEEAASRTSSSR